MSNTKLITRSKASAFFLTVIMIISLMLSGLLSIPVQGQTSGHAYVFTITVKDTYGDPINGAQIVGTFGVISINVSTGEDGVAEVQSITQAILAGSREELILTFTATGYDNIDNESYGQFGTGDHLQNVDTEMTSKIAKITTQPISRNYHVGDTISLSVVAKNAAAYKWYKDSALISGATNASYSKTASISDAGNYKCIVTGIDGIDVSSNEVIITVNTNATAVILVINPIVNGATSVTLSAMGLPGDATGTLTFKHESTVIGTVNVGQTVSFQPLSDTTAYSLTVKYSGDGKYEGSVSSDINFTFSKQEQDSIQITGLDTSYTYGVSQITLGTTGGSNAGGAVTYISSNTDVATVSNDKVTIVGVGTFTITATLAGDSTYNSVSVTSSTVTVSKGNQAAIQITGLNTTYTYGAGQITLGTTGGSNAGGTVTYTSNNTNVAVVSDNKITIVGWGTFTITATLAGNDNYNPVTTTSNQVTVNKANQAAIQITGLNTTYTYGAGVITVGSTGGSVVGGTVTYSSSNTNVATVSNNKVTIVGGGHLQSPQH